jgi:hypothetical protein
MRARTYGIVVDATTTIATLDATRRELVEVDPEEIVLLTVRPLNIHLHRNWASIREAFEDLVGCYSFGVWTVTIAQLPTLATCMTLLRADTQTSGEGEISGFEEIVSITG